MYLEYVIGSYRKVFFKKQLKSLNNWNQQSSLAYCFLYLWFLPCRMWIHSRGGGHSTGLHHLLTTHHTSSDAADFHSQAPGLCDTRQTHRDAEAALGWGHTRSGVNYKEGSLTPGGQGMRNKRCLHGERQVVLRGCSTLLRVLGKVKLQLPWGATLRIRLIWTSLLPSLVWCLAPDPWNYLPNKARACKSPFMDHCLVMEKGLV